MSAIKIYIFDTHTPTKYAVRCIQHIVGTFSTKSLLCSFAFTLIKVLGRSRNGCICLDYH